MVVWRVVATDVRDSPAFVESFRSSHERGLPPRPGSPEERFTVIHRSVSTFDRQDRAAALGRRYALGQFTARLDLPGNAGFCYAQWGSRGHISLMGDALMLAQASVDIVPING
jgi:hypothetical protein